MNAKQLVTLLLALTVFPMIGKSDNDVSKDGKRSIVYQIPIENQIEPALLYVIRRGVKEATKTQADAIVFTMNTPGGRVDVTREILGIIKNIEVPVITFVERDAYSAGAIIALSTPRIFMAPGSVIGDATPILMGMTGGVQDLDEDTREKMKSGVAAMVRSAAEQGGHDPEMAEAMVRKDVEYFVGTNLVSKTGEVLTLTNTEAEGILSEGTVEDLNALLIAIGLPDAEIIKLEVTPAEKIARIIAAMAPILLMLGLGGIYLEIKTPGFGLPGIGGAIALVLFFFGHHIAGLAGLEDFILFIIGFSLLFVEVFITPGFGVLGISGIALILISLLNAMSWQAPGELLPALSGHGPTLQHAMGNLTLGIIGTAIFGGIAGYFLPQSRLARPLMLSTDTSTSAGFTSAPEQPELLNQTGIAEMNLHPAGRARLDGLRVNVITRGEFIEKGSSIRVIEIRGSRIVVEKI